MSQGLALSTLTSWPVAFGAQITAGRSHISRNLPLLSLPCIPLHPTHRAPGPRSPWGIDVKLQARPKAGQLCTDEPGCTPARP